MSGCDYQGFEFGAPYLDSICIDGFLWDADSCDEPGGDLHNGGDIPCPQCNHDSWLLKMGDSVMEDGFNAGYEGGEIDDCPFPKEGAEYHQEYDPHVFRFAWMKGFWDGVWEMKDELRREKHECEDEPLMDSDSD